MSIIANNRPYKQPPKINKNQRAEKALLGISAESSSTTQNQGKKLKYQLLRKAAELLPNERIAQCCNSIAPGASDVTVIYSPKGQTAHYKNLVHCESCSCPNCAHVRSERDRHELSIAIVEAQKRGYFVSMLTCTLRHHLGDKLTDLRHTVATAFDDTFSGRWYQNFKEEWGLIGKIKAWESPHGVNGWHPHLHVLLVTEVRFGVDSERKMESAISDRWIEKLRKLGYDATKEHGVDFRTSYSDVANYIAKWGHEPLDGKWGVDHEIAKAPVKTNKREGMTAFELLAAAAGVEDQLDRFEKLTGAGNRENAKLRAGHLYVEYFNAFKGKPRLYWGKLWNALGMDDALLEYEENNPPEESDAIDVVILEREAWRKIIKHELRAELLQMVIGRDVPRLRAWLREKQIEGLVRQKWET